MIIEIVESRRDVPEGIKRICKEVNSAPIQEEGKENANVEERMNHAQCISEYSDSSDAHF